MKKINIDFTKSEVWNSWFLETPRSALNYEIGVFEDPSFNFPVENFSSKNNSQEFSFSTNGVNYYPLPHTGTTADYLRFNVEPGLFISPYYLHADTISRLSCFCTNTLEEKNIVINRPSGMSVDQLNGNIWVSTREGKLFELWGRPIALKNSLHVDANCLGLKVDGIRKLIWLFYEQQVVLINAEGDLIDQLTLPKKITKLRSAQTSSQSGTMCFAAASSNAASGGLFGCIQFNVIPKYSDKNVQDVGFLDNTHIILSYSNSIIETYDIPSKTFILQSDFSPASDIRISSRENKNHFYVFSNSNKRLYKYGIGTGYLWYKNLSPYVSTGEEFRIGANWGKLDATGRQIYYYSGLRIGAVRDFVSSGEFWGSKLFDKPDDNFFVDFSPVDYLKHAWFNIRQKETSEFPTVISSSSSTSSESSSLSSLSTTSLSTLSSISSSEKNPVVFAMISDQLEFTGPSYNNNNYFYGAINKIASRGDVEFIVTPANSKPAGNSHWTIKQQLGQGFPWYVSVGNEDCKNNANMNYLRNHSSTLPYIVNSGPPNSNGTVYSIDYKECHIVVLNEYYNGTIDCYNFGPAGDFHGNVADKLYDWLVDDLNTNTKPYVFIVGAEPAYPRADQDNGRERDMDICLNKHSTEFERDRFWQLLRDKNVIAYLCGRTRNYNHHNIKGPWQINAGHAQGIGDMGAQSTFCVFTVDPVNDSVNLETWRWNPSKEFELYHFVELRDIPDTSSSSQSSVSNSSISSSNSSSVSSSSFSSSSSSSVSSSSFSSSSSSTQQMSTSSQSDSLSSSDSSSTKTMTTSFSESSPSSSVSSSSPSSSSSSSSTETMTTSSSESSPSSSSVSSPSSSSVSSPSSSSVSSSSSSSKSSSTETMTTSSTQQDFLFCPTEWNADPDFHEKIESNYFVRAWISNTNLNLVPKVDPLGGGGCYDLEYKLIVETVGIINPGDTYRIKIRFEAWYVDSPLWIASGEVEFEDSGSGASGLFTINLDGTNIPPYNQISGSVTILLNVFFYTGVFGKILNSSGDLNPVDTACCSAIPVSNNDIIESYGYGIDRISYTFSNMTEVNTDDCNLYVDFWVRDSGGVKTQFIDVYRDENFTQLVSRGFKERQGSGGGTVSVTLSEENFSGLIGTAFWNNEYQEGRVRIYCS